MGWTAVAYLIVMSRGKDVKKTRTRKTVSYKNRKVY